MVSSQKYFPKNESVMAANLEHKEATQTRAKKEPEGNDDGPRAVGQTPITVPITAQIYEAEITNTSLFNSIASFLSRQSF